MLLITLGAILLGALITGTRPASLSDLQAEISNARVTEIHVVGGLSPENTGYALVQIYWHDGLLHRHTTVQQIRDESPNMDRSGFSNARADVPIVRGDLVSTLGGSSPTGQLRITGEDMPGGTDGTVFGWHVPIWIALGAAAWALAALMTLMAGPEPRRATRWAWFWLFVGTGPLALALYPVLGLPSASQRAEPVGRRLTGGWAFLIALLLPKPPFPLWD